MSLFQSLQEDISFYHSLRFPGRQPSVYSLLWILCSSRGLLILASQRIMNSYSRIRYTGYWGWLLKQLLCIIVHICAYLTKIFAKSELLHLTKIDPGVYLSNRGHIILGASCIGSGTIIHDRVTFGKNLADRGIPDIGRDVWIGPCCIVYGKINIGDGVTVLPGSVITKSIPPGVVVQGNPARIVKSDFDYSKLRSSVSVDCVF